MIRKTQLFLLAVSSIMTLSFTAQGQNLHDQSARKTPGETIDLAYPSWPLGDVTSGDSRLKVSTDAADFFSQEGTVGMKASQRLRGIVYHDILSRVRVPSDLGDAVRAAVGKGEIEAADAPSVEEFLREKIESVRPLNPVPFPPESYLITTGDYPSPMLIQGAGAGTRQTAGGLLNDILMSLYR